MRFDDEIIGKQFLKRGLAFCNHAIKNTFYKNDITTKILFRSFKILQNKIDVTILQQQCQTHLISKLLRYNSIHTPLYLFYYLYYKIITNKIISKNPAEKPNQKKLVHYRNYKSYM